MARAIFHSSSALFYAVAALIVAQQATCATARGQDSQAAAPVLQKSFQQRVQPLLNKHCLRCHNANTTESGVRLDRLDGALEDRQLFLWKAVLEQVEDEAMPPEQEPQPTAEQRRQLIGWIDEAMAAARAMNREKNGSVRRLTVSQYRNTLRDLLGIEDNLADALPADAISKEGFVNNAQTLEVSPLLMESYLDIADKALDRCIVDEQSRPAIQSFRMELGAAVNPDPCPDKLILGASSHLLRNEDFVVSQLRPDKPFAYEPFLMRTKYRFIEGYQGNDTVRGWRQYDSIYHAVFACMRGTEGYPKGRAYQVVPEGLLLRPAIPSAELFQVESTYGPKANFKVSLRELPDQGRFRVTVKAARYNDGLLLDPGTEARTEPHAAAVTIKGLAEPQAAAIAKEGIYQVDVHLAEESQKSRQLSLRLGERHFAGALVQPAFLAVRLSAGRLMVTAQCDGDLAPQRIVLTPLPESHEIARQFEAFEKRSPRVGVHLGLRRDCGSTLTQVGNAQTVSTTELKEFVFEGAVSNYPSPDVEKDNVNYLAGIREIGVRSEFTDGRDMPRLLVRSVEFEGPYYESWPPATHRRIFIDSDHNRDSPEYASDVIRAFATRAFRRPVTEGEMRSLLAVWEESFAETGSLRQGVKDALLVVLTSPQFLFLVESSAGPQAEALDSYELASKLSYFLWNTAPDEQLLQLAAAGGLRESLDAEIERMIRDPRFGQFAHEFTSQWLSLDKFDVVEVDRQRYPRLTRDTRTQLRREPVRFLEHLIRNNLPLRNLIQSDFIMANEVVASYYGLGDRVESGFEFVPVNHDSSSLGGVLAQAGILAGLSDGRESNPVKRGAWLARKIIGEPPQDPPPNVPALPEDDGADLTLREKLQRHRDQPGCATCHAGIDPWGLPLEQFDAGGLFKRDRAVDARSTLPDGTEVADASALKAYLADDRIDQVAFSFLKHLASYATGRSLSFGEIEMLREKGLELKAHGYRLRDMVRLVVHSELFLSK